MYQRILLPTDGSAAMETVFEQTADIAGRRDATVHVLYVVDDRAFLTLQEDMKSDVMAELREEGDEATDAAAEWFEARDVNVVTAVRKGNPADQILAYTDEYDVDLITMGTHGKEYTQSMLGSVSQKVVTMADVPVLTVNIADAEA